MGKEPGFFVSKSNRRAVIYLLFLLTIIVFLPRVILMFDSNNDYLITSEEEKEKIAEVKNSFRYKSSDYTKRKKDKRKYFAPKERFDPNTYSAKQWQALGLSPKQTTVVLKFVAYGVDSKEDIRRIVVIPDELYNLIKDSLVFPERKYNQSGNYHKSKVRDIQIVELNSCTKAELDSLPGIGDYLAGKIIYYRDKLGGYVRKEQLLEINKINVETFTKIEKYIWAEPSGIKAINLNKVSAENLKAHPYFNWHIANSIVKMRTQKGGNFKNIEEILESALIDQEFFEKVKPYLSL